MTITKEIITKTSVDVTKQDKDFLRAYYKKVLDMALEDLDYEDLENIFPSSFENGKIEYGFSGRYLRDHFRFWFLDIFYNRIRKYKCFNIEWNEGGENESLNLLSLIDDEDIKYGNGNLSRLVSRCCVLTKNEEVFNEILSPIIKKHIKLLMKKNGITLDFDYTNEITYLNWKLGWYKMILSCESNW